MSDATRANVQNPVERTWVLTPYYDFYEYYFKEATDAFSRIDLEVRRKQNPSTIAASTPAHARCLWTVSSDECQQLGGREARPQWR